MTHFSPLLNYKPSLAVSSQTMSRKALAAGSSVSGRTSKNPTLARCGSGNTPVQTYSALGRKRGRESLIDEGRNKQGKNAFSLTVDERGSTLPFYLRSSASISGFTFLCNVLTGQKSSSNSLPQSR
jgi:hypothetical protein